MNILKNCRAVHNKFDARRDVVRPFCLDFIWISKLPQTVLLIQPAFGWAGRFCPWTFVDCFRPCLHFPVFPSSFQVYFCLCCERYKFAREISRRCEARLSRFWTGAPTSSAPIFFFFGEQSFLREPPGWLAGPGDRGGLGLGHGFRSHIELSGDTRWGRDQHDRREDAQSNLSARESHCWELICLLKLIPLRLNLSKLMFSLSFPPCHQLRNTQVSLKRWYLKEWIWTTVIYHSKTLTPKS